MSNNHFRCCKSISYSQNKSPIWQKSIRRAPSIEHIYILNTHWCHAPLGNCVSVCVDGRNVVLRLLQQKQILTVALNYDSDQIFQPVVLFIILDLIRLWTVCCGSALYLNPQIRRVMLNETTWNAKLLFFCLFLHKWQAVCKLEDFQMEHTEPRCCQDVLAHLKRSWKKELFF